MNHHLLVVSPCGAYCRAPSLILDCQQLPCRIVMSLAGLMWNSWEAELPQKGYHPASLERTETIRQGGGGVCGIIHLQYGGARNIEERENGYFLSIAIEIRKWGDRTQREGEREIEEET